MMMGSLQPETSEDIVSLGVGLSGHRMHRPPKASSPILITLSGTVMVWSFSQSAKAHPPIWVTPSGIAMLIKLLQL